MLAIHKPDKLKILAIIFASSFAIFCFLNQYPVVYDACKCADAYAYFTIGDLFSKHGIIPHDWSRLRLYGYPIFLAPIFLLSHLTSLNVSLLIAITQVILYFGAAYTYFYGLNLAKHLQILFFMP